MYINRDLDVEGATARRSVFLFGPRQTGKSTLIKTALKPARTINLLDHQTFLRLNADPSLLRREIPSEQKGVLIVIDEIQRVPELLNEVHLQIEENGLRFLLTGSSARKLRKGGVNLLGGRARSRNLLPFSALELGEHFSLERALLWGTLPPIWFSEEPEEDLAAYVNNYLQQEILAEGLSRSVPAFGRFLLTAAANHSQQLNFTMLASDAAVPRTTLHGYFDILKDTLLGDLLEPLALKGKRKAVATPKFFFFDNGVVNAILGRKSVTPGSREFGECFEGHIHHELRCHIANFSPTSHLTFWRTTTGLEVDFVLDDTFAIECKAKSRISNDDLKGLRSMAEENLVKNLCLVYLGEQRLRDGNIEIWPWRAFLEHLRDSV